jgi:predicted Holliday junction resolvase-like endonuclease
MIDTHFWVLSERTSLYFLLIGASALVLILFVGLVYWVRQYMESQAAHHTYVAEELRSMRQKFESATKSRAVLRGQFAERLFPLMTECPYAAIDMIFLGRPFDYLVLQGYQHGAIEEVVFVEIKTGQSSLSSIQRSLRDCIESGRVRWVTHTIKELCDESLPSSS